MGGFRPSPTESDRGYRRVCRRPQRGCGRADSATACFPRWRCSRSCPRGVPASRRAQTSGNALGRCSPHRDGRRLRFNVPGWSPLSSIRWWFVLADRLGRALAGGAVGCALNWRLLFAVGGRPATGPGRWRARIADRKRGGPRGRGVVPSATLVVLWPGAAGRGTGSARWFLAGDGPATSRRPGLCSWRRWRWGFRAGVSRAGWRIRVSPGFGRGWVARLALAISTLGGRYPAAAGDARQRTTGPLWRAVRDALAPTGVMDPPWLSRFLHARCNLLEENPFVGVRDDPRERTSSAAEP